MRLADDDVGRAHPQGASPPSRVATWIFLELEGKAALCRLMAGDVFLFLELAIFNMGLR